MLNISSFWSPFMTKLKPATHNQKINGFVFAPSFIEKCITAFRSAGFRGDSNNTSNPLTMYPEEQLPGPWFLPGECNVCVLFWVSFVQQYCGCARTVLR